MQVNGRRRKKFPSPPPSLPLAHANSPNGAQIPDLNNSQLQLTLPCTKTSARKNSDQMAAYAAWGHVTQLQDQGLRGLCIWKQQS